MNDILDMAKIENGKIQMKPAPYSQEEFVHSMQTIFAKQCEEKQIELVFDMGTGARTILVDR